MISNSHSQIIKPFQHLYELYHELPKFANDPSQSPIIKAYDLILKRFQGVYGRQPTYFIRSPTTASLFGSIEEFVSFSTVSFCSSQNVVIAIALNGHHQIRVNHYQNAIYGEKTFSDQVSSLKYGNLQSQEEYNLLLTICLKTFASLNGMQNLAGLDILIYDDFIQDSYFHSKQAFCFGIYTSLHFALKPKTEFKKDILLKFIDKVQAIKNDIKKINLPLICKEHNLTIHSEKNGIEKEIIFQKDLSFVIAHSMTPLPKKLIKGKRQNLRNCQILMGIQIIKSQMGANNSIKSLKQLQTYLDCSIPQLIQSVGEYLPKGILNAEKIEQLTEKSLIDILRQVPYANNVIDQNTYFNPYNRIMFYLNQQLLVSKLQTQNIVQTLKESHEKSIELLEIGSQQIEQMISIVKDLALGWKIIGNGYGGNLLFICKKNYAQKIVDQLTNQFYTNEKNKILLSDDIEQYIRILNGPATGLSVLNPESEIWY